MLGRKKLRPILGLATICNLPNPTGTAKLQLCNVVANSFVMMLKKFGGPGCKRFSQLN